MPQSPRANDDAEGVYWKLLAFFPLPSREREGPIAEQWEGEGALATSGFILRQPPHPPASRVPPSPAGGEGPGRTWVTPLVATRCRLGATRLRGKPLADIHGEPMIVHVWRRAVEAAIGPVVVACAEAEIAAAIERAGGSAVLTDPNHPVGTDRVHEAVRRLDPDRRHEIIANLQS